MLFIISVSHVHVNVHVPLYIHVHDGLLNITYKNNNTVHIEYVSRPICTCTHCVYMYFFMQKT